MDPSLDRRGGVAAVARERRSRQRCSEAEEFLANRYSLSWRRLKIVDCGDRRGVLPARVYTAVRCSVELVQETWLAAAGGESAKSTWRKDEARWESLATKCVKRFADGAQCRKDW